MRAGCWDGNPSILYTQEEPFPRTHAVVVFFPASSCDATQMNSRNGRANRFSETPLKKKKRQGMKGRRALSVLRSSPLSSRLQPCQQRLSSSFLQRETFARRGYATGYIPATHGPASARFEYDYELPGWGMPVVSVSPFPKKHGVAQVNTTHSGRPLASTLSNRHSGQWERCSLVCIPSLSCSIALQAVSSLEP